MAKGIDDLLKKDIDIVWTAPDSSVYKVATTRTLLLTAVRRNKPVFGFSPAFVRAGALLGVGINPQTQGEQAGRLAEQLLNEDKPKVNPIQAPQFEIALNLIVAEKLSVKIPKTLEERATHFFRQKK